MEEYVIQHHGILGQKWGVRRYQNADGSLTAVGKVHYKTTASELKRASDKAEKARSNFLKSEVNSFKRLSAYNKMFNADQKLKEVLNKNKDVKVSDLKGLNDKEAKAYIDQLIRARNLNKTGFKNY